MRADEKTNNTAQDSNQITEMIERSGFEKRKGGKSPKKSKRTGLRVTTRGGVIRVISDMGRAAWNPTALSGDARCLLNAKHWHYERGSATQSANSGPLALPPPASPRPLTDSWTPIPCPRPPTTRAAAHAPFGVAHSSTDAAAAAPATPPPPPPPPSTEAATRRRVRPLRAPRGASGGGGGSERNSVLM